MSNKVHIIFGATASGKTAYAVGLAKELNGEVINADSQQVYKEIPILSAAPTETEKEGIPHHLYGFASCFEQYSVGQYISDANEHIAKVRALNKTPILVGGTGLYIKRLVEGLSNFPKISKDTKAKVSDLMNSIHDLYPYLSKLDSATAAKIKPNDKQRINRALEVIIESGQPLSYFQKDTKQINFKRHEYHIIWLNPERNLIYEKINQRFLDMLKSGAIEEVSKLIQASNGRPLPKSCGIAELQAYLTGSLALEQAIAKAQQTSRNYAKRQITWARHQLEFDEIL